jgi:hypothetical protein
MSAWLAVVLRLRLTGTDTPSDPPANLRPRTSRYGCGIRLTATAPHAGHPLKPNRQLIESVSCVLNGHLDPELYGDRSIMDVGDHIMQRLLVAIMLPRAGCCPLIG